MPVVIRELHVKVNVEEENSGGRRNRPDSGRQADRDAIIDECVEKVMEIMKQEERR